MRFEKRVTKSMDLNGDVEVLDNGDLIIDGELVAHTFDGRIEFDYNRIRLEDREEAATLLWGIHKMYEKMHGEGLLVEENVEEEVSSLKKQIDKMIKRINKIEE